MEQFSSRATDSPIGVESSAEQDNHLGQASSGADSGVVTPPAKSGGEATSNRNPSEEELARQATRAAIEQGQIPLAGGLLKEGTDRDFGKRNMTTTRVLGTIDSFKESNSKSDAGLDVKTVETAPPVEVTLRTLLEAGAHFGHQTSRWNPAMAPYIYGSRNGIHIINLPKTVQAWSRAKAAIEEMAAQGGSFLFVGTKKQAQEPVAAEATRGNSFFVAERWLGGMLTNFSTVRRSVDRMKKLEEILKSEEERIAQNATPKFTKKERLMFARELKKLESSIGGIKEMTSLPSMLFVIDIKREEIAIKEANRLDIPVVALVDTNCDPAAVQYPIPSNDDGTRAISLFCQAVSDSILAGKRRYVPKAVEVRADSATKREDRKDSRPQRPRKRNDGKIDTKLAEPVAEAAGESEEQADAIA